MSRGTLGSLLYIKSHTYIYSVYTISASLRCKHFRAVSEQRMARVRERGEIEQEPKNVYSKATNGL